MERDVYLRLQPLYRQLPKPKKSMLRPQDAAHTVYGFTTGGASHAPKAHSLTI